MAVFSTGEGEDIKNKAPASAYIAIISQSIIIGFTPLVVKVSQQYASAFDMLSLRLAIAFLLSLIMVLVRREKIRITGRQFLSILPLLIVYPLLFFTTQVFALQTLPASEAGIINAIAPIVTVILAAIFLREHTNRIQVLFIILSMAGVVFLMTMKGASPAAFDVRGTLIMIANMLSYAVYAVLLRRQAGRYSAYFLTFYITAIGFVVFTGFALGQHAVAGTLVSFFAPLADWRFALCVLFLGGFAVFGTSALSSYALSKLESSKMIVFSNLSVVISIVAGVLFLSERLYWYHVVGAVVIIAGVLGTNWLGGRKKAPGQEKS